MNRFPSLFLLITLCLAAPYSSTAKSLDYGVGFGLAWDHGTCSIYFANGSTVDVAKIEGNTHYQDLMHHIHDMVPTNHAEPSSTRSTALSILQNHSAIPSLLRRILNRWQPRHPDSAAVGDMLAALKTAAESYLSVSISTADLVTPLPPSPSGKQLLDSATYLAGLHRATGYPVAGCLAAMANGIGDYYQNPGKCYDETTPSRLVLTVDYGRTALTAILYFEEMCIFDVLRVRHDVNLGTTALDKCQASKYDEDCSKPLKDALHGIVKMPVDNVHWPKGSSVPTKLGGLVLLGDKGTDPRLRRVLQQVLVDQGIFVPIQDSQQEAKSMLDPTFAAARGIAAASWGEQNDPFKEDL